MKEYCIEIREQKLGAGHLCCRLLLYEFKGLSQTFVYIYFNYYYAVLSCYFYSLLTFVRRL